MSLTKDENKLLKYIKKSKETGRSANEIAKFLGKAKKNALKIVHRLEEQDLVSGFGKSQNVRYRLSNYNKDKYGLNVLQKELRKKEKEEKLKIYRDNAEFRHNIYSSLESFLQSLSETFNIKEDNLKKLFNDPESFKQHLYEAKMKDISVNIVDSINNLKEGIDYAIGTPHSTIEVSEEKMNKKIKELINDYLPNLDHITGMSSIHFNRDVGSSPFSFADVLKDLIIGKDANKFWDDSIMEKLTSYEIKLKQFLDFLRWVKESKNYGNIQFTVILDDEDVTNWVRHLMIALKNLVNLVSDFKSLLNQMQDKQGKFEQFIDK